jgi:hypothetical protein
VVKTDFHAFANSRKREKTTPPYSVVTNANYFILFFPTIFHLRQWLIGRALRGQRRRRNYKKPKSTLFASLLASEASNADSRILQVSQLRNWQQSILKSTRVFWVIKIYLYKNIIVIYRLRIHLILK